LAGEGRNSNLEGQGRYLKGPRIPPISSDWNEIDVQRGYQTEKGRKNGEGILSYRGKEEHIRKIKIYKCNRSVKGKTAGKKREREARASRGVALFLY